MTYNHKVVEGLALLRDGLTMAVDGINTILDAMEPKELHYDISKIVTQQAEGRNGVYIKATATDNQDNPDFKALVEDLKAHNGKLTRQGYFVWLFDRTETETVGMKKSKRRGNT